MSKIKVSPMELRAQASEMTAVKNEFGELSKKTVRIMNNVNHSWGGNIANNFERKIISAQKSLNSLEEALGVGAAAATVSATTFLEMDQLLAKEMKKNNSIMDWINNWINNIHNAHNGNSANGNTGTNGASGTSPNKGYPGNDYGLKDPNYGDLSNYNVISGFNPAMFVDANGNPVFDQNLYNRFWDEDDANVGCTAISEAIMETIKNGKFFDPNSDSIPWYHIHYDSGAISSGMDWSRVELTQPVGPFNSQADYMGFLYSKISAGEPMTVRLDNGHSVVVIGMKNDIDANNLSVGDFLMLDPWGGQIKPLSHYGVGISYGLPNFSRVLPS